MCSLVSAEVEYGIFVCFFIIIIHLYNSFTIFLLPLIDLLLLICLGGSLWLLNGKILKAINPAILLQPILECHHLCVVKYIFAH